MPAAGMPAVCSGSVDSWLGDRFTDPDSVSALPLPNSFPRRASDARECAPPEAGPGVGGACAVATLLLAVGISMQQKSVSVRKEELLAWVVAVVPEAACIQGARD